ncbi:MAG: hypothetical protein ACRECH_04805 [Nitrososphaerales archaeon]
MNRYLKSSFLALGILGLVLILFGGAFALQGDGMIGGSAMSGNPFWIYAGSGVAVLGIILAVLGFSLGSRKSRTPKTVTTEEKARSSAEGEPSASASASQPKK